VLAALHILASPGMAPARLIVFERANKVAGGVAFSTPYQSHLLNVPASSMSAFSEDPEHFARWLDHQGQTNRRDDFLGRQLYRRYLADTLRALGHPGTGGDLLELRQDEVVDIEPAGIGAYVRPARSEPVIADAVILALGIVPPRLPQGLVCPGAESHCLGNPWDAAALAAIERSATVTLIGTGLSAVDVLLALRENGHRGAVHAVSRHGLLPQKHTAGPRPEPGSEGRAQEVNSPQARGLLHQVRVAVAETEAQGGNWRDIVDLLRPRAQDLWMGLDAVEQARFKRHLERFWSVHRHRMAPEVGREVEGLSDRGLFHVHSGQVLAVEAPRSQLRVAVKTLPSGQVHHWGSDWLVNCSGPDPNVFRDDQVLANSLHSRGLARPGPLGLGVDTDSAGKVIGASGQAAEWLWAMGSLRQGQLYESTAVPEIRLQAQDIATQVRAKLRDDDHGRGPLERECLVANY
jgi:uncharacterized NAD(P)/FAD-binding protein YdhS